MEQMAMNVAVKASEQRFRVIFENSQAVMLLIDPETHRIVTANNAAQRFYGWERRVLETMCIDAINTLSPEAIQAEKPKAANVPIFDLITDWPTATYVLCRSTAARLILMARLTSIPSFTTLRSRSKQRGRYKPASLTTVRCLNNH
jgi:PAS domain-containing protein